ncbi:MAG: hypothetical protein Q9162_007235 [Coniocarpon cinnabarinum]
MPVKTLFHLATAALVRGRRRITDVGDAPWEFVEPAIRKIDDPVQLETLEQNSPWLKKHDAEIWISIIKREAPFFDISNYIGKPDTEWLLLYQKAKHAREKKVIESTKVLAAKLASGQQEKKSHEMQTAAPGRIRTANSQGNRSHWSQMGRKEPPNLSKGQKLLAKAKRESNNALAARNNGVKQISPQQMRRNLEPANQVGPRTNHAPAPLPQSSAALLQTRRGRESGAPLEITTEKQKGLERGNAGTEGPSLSSRDSAISLQALRNQETPATNQTKQTTSSRDKITTATGAQPAGLSEKSTAILQARRERENTLAHRPPITPLSRIQKPQQSPSIFLQRPSLSQQRTLSAPTGRASAQYQGTMKRNLDSPVAAPAVKRQRIA